MKEFTVSEQATGKKVLRFLSQALLPYYGDIPILFLQKALKNKDIKINGKRIHKDEVLNKGDHISLFLPDKYLQTRKQKQDTGLNALPSYLQDPQFIVYEDKNLLLINKPQGISVHAGSGIKQGESLIEVLRKQRKNENLTLVHRIDRNTGGLLLLCKNKHVLSQLQWLIQQNGIHKKYRCLVKGIPNEGSPIRLPSGEEMLEITAFLEKSKNQDEVFIHQVQQEGDLPIVTRYRVLHIFTSLGLSQEPVSELEVELITGRTHQIRAHFAHLGHPLLGDGKYGRNDFNSLFSNKRGGKLKYQQLFATSLQFSSKVPVDLKAIQGKTFQIQSPYDVQGL